MSICVVCERHLNFFAPSGVKHVAECRSCGTAYRTSAYKRNWLGRRTLVALKAPDLYFNDFPAFWRSCGDIDPIAIAIHYWRETRKPPFPSFAALVSDIKLTLRPEQQEMIAEFSAWLDKNYGMPYRDGACQTDRPATPVSIESCKADPDATLQIPAEPNAA